MTANFILSTLLMAVTAAPRGEIPARAADAHDFSRYQIILDRSPFSPPVGSVVEVQPNFAARFSFIGTAKTNATEPVMAIIQDKEANNRIYFKTEGEAITNATGAVTVVSIGQSPGAKLLLKQGLETATLTLETKAGVGAAPPAPTPAAGAPQPGQPVPQGVRRIPFQRGQ